MLVGEGILLIFPLSVLTAFHTVPYAQVHMMVLLFLLINNVKQAFREFQVSPALISNLNVDKGVGLSHVKCKIMTSFCDVIYLFASVFT